MIFPYFFVRFWFSCYTCPPLSTREIVVLAYRSCAIPVTWREELNRRSNRTKSICVHHSLAFMAFAVQSWLPFLSKTQSKVLVCCVVNQNWNTRLFSVAERHKAFAHLWQGKVISGGYLLGWLLVQTYFYKVILCLNWSVNVLKSKTFS